MMSSLTADHEEYILETRDVGPAHLLTTIKSVSMLSKHEINGKLESTVFSSGGYKWKVIFNLDDEMISANLVVDESSYLGVGWEVHAMFNFFLYDHISDKYLCFRGKARRFHVANPECGFTNLMSKDGFREASNGYIVKDKCVFGAEVFVITNKPLTECLSVLRSRNAPNYVTKFDMKIPKFSKRKHRAWKSKGFYARGYEWQIQIQTNLDETYVSAYLDCVDSRVLHHGDKVNVEFQLFLKGKLHDHSKWEECWFSSKNQQHGFYSFIKTGEMRDPSKGFLVNDCCIFGVNIY